MDAAVTWAVAAGDHVHEAPQTPPAVIHLFDDDDDDGDGNDNKASWGVREGDRPLGVACGYPLQVSQRRPLASHVLRVPVSSVDAKVAHSILRAHCAGLADNSGDRSAASGSGLGFPSTDALNAGRHLSAGHRAGHTRADRSESPAILLGSALGGADAGRSYPVGFPGFVRGQSLAVLPREPAKPADPEPAKLVAGRGDAPLNTGVGATTEGDAPVGNGLAATGAPTEEMAPPPAMGRARPAVIGGGTSTDANADKAGGRPPATTDAFDSLGLDDLPVDVLDAILSTAADEVAPMDAGPTVAPPTASPAHNPVASEVAPMDAGPTVAPPTAAPAHNPVASEVAPMDAVATPVPTIPSAGMTQCPMCEEFVDNGAYEAHLGGGCEMLGLFDPTM